LWQYIWATGAYKNGLKLLYTTNAVEIGFQPTGGSITGLVSTLGVEEVYIRCNEDDGSVAQQPI